MHDVDWQVVGVGDSNGDGKADILWRHVTTGDNAIWLMSGLVQTNDQTALPRVTKQAMQVMGMGDFNGDGKADLLWRNTHTGGNHIWLLDGRTRTNTSTSIAALTDLHWQMVGRNTCDYDGTDDAGPAAATDEAALEDELETLSAEPFVMTEADAEPEEEAPGEELEK
jgi:FG-GAP-like repeat